jgi:hypothetical protein
MRILIADDLETKPCFSVFLFDQYETASYLFRTARTVGVALRDGYARSPSRDCSGRMVTRTLHCATFRAHDEDLCYYYRLLCTLQGVLISKIVNGNNINDDNIMTLINNERKYSEDGVERCRTSVEGKNANQIFLGNCPRLTSGSLSKLPRLPCSNHLLTGVF